MIRFEMRRIFLNNTESKTSFPFLREGGFKLRRELKDGRVVFLNDHQ